jgi:hypothetical protein
VCWDTMFIQATRGMVAVHRYGYAGQSTSLVCGRLLVCCFCFFFHSVWEWKKEIVFVVACLQCWKVWLLIPINVMQDIVLICFVTCLNESLSLQTNIKTFYCVFLVVIFSSPFLINFFLVKYNFFVRKTRAIAKFIIKTTKQDDSLWKTTTTTHTHTHKEYIHKWKFVLENVLGNSNYNNYNYNIDSWGLWMLNSQKISELEELNLHTHQQFLFKITTACEHELSV